MRNQTIAGILVFLFILSMSFSIEAAINIPDPKLKNVIRQTLDNPDIITAENISTITKLDANNQGITSITGLEHATNLTELNLDSNNISDLSPLKGLTKLRVLYLYHNNISNLSPLAQLANLQELDIENNNISDLSPLGNLANLHLLNTRNNAISNIAPLLNLPRLEWLDITANHITSDTNIRTLENKGINVEYSISEKIPTQSQTKSPTEPQPAVASGITVYINNSRINLSDPPVIQSSRTLVPMRALFESLGATVEWDTGTNTATGKRDGTTITIPINSTQPKVNNQTVPIDVPAQLINSRTYIPLRFVSEALGDRVEWDGTKQQIDIFR